MCPPLRFVSASSVRNSAGCKRALLAALAHSFPCKPHQILLFSSFPIRQAQHHVNLALNWQHLPSSLIFSYKRCDKCNPLALPKVALSPALVESILLLPHPQSHPLRRSVSASIFQKANRQLCASNFSLDVAQPQAQELLIPQNTMNKGTK